ncbi:hypothetical protein T265_02542 [Opisthorchis viverrini]|uniref:Uncharacterized protein n=1 Tax=Opisthorchis viverrini TaxID=6198 RepID=A0A074ZVU7_OPIVI|nr:hypothetical protein T265_02542 [Opisthorchis viverrini]KER31226.1 hypothetical protein T265_02542 [Opisthorchis viverrini]
MSEYCAGTQPDTNLNFLSDEPHEAPTGWVVASPHTIALADHLQHAQTIRPHKVFPQTIHPAGQTSNFCSFCKKPGELNPVHLSLTTSKTMGMLSASWSNGRRKVTLASDSTTILSYRLMEQMISSCWEFAQAPEDWRKTKPLPELESRTFEVIPKSQRAVLFGTHNPPDFLKEKPALIEGFTYLNSCINLDCDMIEVDTRIFTSHALLTELEMNFTGAEGSCVQVVNHSSQFRKYRTSVIPPFRHTISYKSMARELPKEFKRHAFASDMSLPWKPDRQCPTSRALYKLRYRTVKPQTCNFSSSDWRYEGDRHGSAH